MIRFILLLAVMALANMHAAQSQIINIENARMHSDTVGWMGHVGLSGSLTKNTEQVLMAQINAQVQYKTKKDLFLVLGNYGFLSGSSVNLINNSFAHIRYNRKLTESLRFEVFSQVLQNAITKIDYRFLQGAGPRFKVINKNNFRFYLASLIMFEHEKEIASPAIIHNDWRSSSYASLSWQPNANTELVSTFFYQPLFTLIADYRFFNQSQFTVKAGKRLSLAVNYNYLFDTRPAGATPKVNYTLSTGLQYHF